MTFKGRLYEILEPPQPDDKLSRNFDVFIITLIAFNVLTVVLVTVDSLGNRFRAPFRLFEIFSVVIFTIEYAARLWTASENQEYNDPLISRLRFVLSPLAIIDILAIIPFYLPMFIPFDLRFLRALRLMRIFRLFKIGRYSEGLRVFIKVLRSKKEELVITGFVGFILLIVTSSLMFFIENQAQPEAFSSIPHALWWGVTTLTTVGYGDVYPITGVGKLLAAVISVVGVGLFALPAGILASGFYEQVVKTDKEPQMRCPYCDKDINTK